MNGPSQNAVNASLQMRADRIDELEKKLKLAMDTLENIKSKETPFKPEDAAALALDAIKEMN